MNCKPVRTAVRYLAAWSLVACFVVLLTLIFNFLGTILCAVLGGMMLGAMKQARWHAIPGSLLLPTVLLILLRVTKAELSPLQSHVLALVCFGAFWLMFVLSAALVSFERKAQASPVCRSEAAAAPGVRRALDPAGQATSRHSAAVVSLAAAHKLTGQLALAELQGKWLFEPSGPNGHAHKKVMEIREDKLVLRILDPDGRVRFQARGEVELVLLSVEDEA